MWRPINSAFPFFFFFWDVQFGLPYSAAGLEVLQEKHLIHRDLKPQVFLFLPETPDSNSYLTLSKDKNSLVRFYSLSEGLLFIINLIFA